MNKVRGKPVIPPDLSALLDQTRDDTGAQLRVALPGYIWSYDSTKGTAQIVPGYNRVYNDGTVKPAVLLNDCPIIRIQGSGIHVGMPIRQASTDPGGVGDECLVVFGDFNIDAWFQNGGQQTPMDTRRHDLSDGFAIIGPNSLANAIATALLAGEGGIASADAKVALKTTLGVTKVTIANQTQNLLTILKTLLNALAASTQTDGSSFNATTITAINAAITQLQGLLY